MSSSTTQPPATYIPGHAGCKLVMILAGLAMFAFGTSQLWLPVRLVLFGNRAQAEAVSVVKTKTGLPPILLRTDAEIEAQREPRDRSYVFWNEFRFETPSGASVTVRAGGGSQVGPLYPLLDADGLPTTTPVYYDPVDPGKAAFPLIVSTWLPAAVIALAGLFAASIAAVLLYWSRIPIELPHIPTKEEMELAHRRRTSSDQVTPD